MAIKQLQMVRATEEDDERGTGFDGPIKAAGILFYAQDTGKFLSLYRSADVVDGNCWCGAGGKMEDDETPEQTARREVDEELGFDTFENEGQYIPLYLYKSPQLTFYNFLGIVETQFFPMLNWESAGYAWTNLDQIPTPHHYGTTAILHDDQALAIIKKYTGQTLSGTPRAKVQTVSQVLKQNLGQ